MIFRKKYLFTCKYCGKKHKTYMNAELCASLDIKQENEGKRKLIPIEDYKLKHSIQ